VLIACVCRLVVTQRSRVLAKALENDNATQLAPLTPAQQKALPLLLSYLYTSSVTVPPEMVGHMSASCLSR